MERIENVGCNKWKKKYHTVLCCKEREVLWHKTKETYGCVVTPDVTDPMCYGVM